MTKPIINNFGDLIAEKARLKAELQLHKQGIKTNFNAIKQELNPFSNNAKTTRQVFRSNRTNPLLSLGVGKITDLIVRKFILARAGWFTRFLAPVIIKKIATYLVAKNGGDKIARLLHNTADKLRGEDDKIPQPHIKDRLVKV